LTVVAAVGDVDTAVDAGQNSYATISRASPPNTMSAVTCFRFSAPSFNYPPDRR
jgi:hypothetical protein